VTLVISAQTKKASAAFAGAVVLASGAYAVGSQSGDGSANANQAGASGPMAGGPPGAHGAGPPSGQMRREFRRQHRQMFANLAKQLGVEEADLRKALTEIRKERRDDFTAKLAKKLGISEAKVKQALPERPKGGGRGRGFGGPPPGGPPPGP